MIKKAPGGWRGKKTSYNISSTWKLRLANAQTTIWDNVKKGLNRIRLLLTQDLLT